MSEYFFEKMNKIHSDAKAKKGPRKVYKGYKGSSRNTKKIDIQRQDKIRRKQLKKRRYIAVGRRNKLMRCMTPAELKFKEILDSIMGQRAGVMEYQPQYIFEIGKDKQHYYILDFFVSKPKFIDFEIDGGIHNQQQEYDNRRDSAVESRGVRVIRYKNEKVLFQTEDVRNEVSRILGEGRI